MKKLLQSFMYENHHKLAGNWKRKQYFKGLSSTLTETPKRFWAYYRAKYKNNRIPTSLQYNGYSITILIMFSTEMIVFPFMTTIFSVTLKMTTSLLVT